MKKLILSLITIISLSFAANADNGDQHVNVNIGVAAPYTLNATAGYEYEFKNGHAAEIYAEFGNHWDTAHSMDCVDFWKGYFWDGGAVYKYRIAKFKNSNLKIRGGVQFGAFVREFFIGAEVSFEYSYVFANNWELSVIERNNFNFIHGDTFRNGLMIGVKIPF